MFAVVSVGCIVGVHHGGIHPVLTIIQIAGLISRCCSACNNTAT